MRPIGWKRVFGLVAAIAATGLVVAPPAHAAVAIDNPGMEGTFNPTTGCATGAIAPGWTDNTCWDGVSRITYTRDTTNKRSGASSQRVRVTAGRVQFGQFLAQPGAVGTTYTVSFWIRGSSVPVLAKLRQQGEPYDVYASALVQPTSTWMRYEFSGVTTATSLVLLFNAERPTTFWLDDVTITESAAPALTPPSTPVPAAYFGTHLNRADTPWPAIGNSVGLIRIWDSGPSSDGSIIGAQWADINTAPGVYDWSGLDARVAAATAKGAEILYVLGGRTPPWASARPDEYSPYGSGQAAEPSSTTLWTQWVRAVTTRYRGVIKHWEVWNEPDLANFYTGSPARLVSLGKAAYTAIKRVDPSNVVVSPGFSGFDGTGWLQYYLANGGAAASDVIGYHQYIDAPETASQWRVANIRQTAERFAPGKPLWNTEQGWVNPDDPFSMPVETGAALVARSALVNWASGMQRYAYYTWDNEWNLFSFTGPDGVTPSLAGVAYQTVAQWMTGRTVEAFVADPSGLYTVTLRAPDGSRTRAVWRTSGPASFVVPADWGATSVQLLDGSSTAIPGAGAITVGESPVLLA